MEAEQYGYYHSQAIDLGSIIPAMQFRVIDEAGTYLCVTCTLVFKGSILAYNPARDEVEWVPTCGLADNLTWVEERSAVALANYVPHISQEVAQIARLGARQLMSWPADPSTSEEEDEEHEEEEQKEGEEWEEADPKQPIMDAEPEQSEEDQEGEQDLSRWHSQGWEMLMGEEE